MGSKLGTIAIWLALLGGEVPAVQSLIDDPLIGADASYANAPDAP